jgi:Uma2 family endonuclease
MEGGMLEHMPAGVDRRRFTADEYQRMGEAGILGEDDRVELIDGEIVTMSPVGSPTSSAVDRVTQRLVLRLGERAIVRVQGPVRLDAFTEPQPDITILRPRDDFYRAGHPHPADVLLVIEVVETSLRYDRDVKAPLYARAGIVEYWLADLTGNTVTCHASPQQGMFRDVTVRRRGEALSPRSLPGVTITVDDLM